ncbi:MAG: domain S-box protein [Pedosphaera sp.]|nr:domain S-box protein [Pedosphaera sp.]
MRATEEKELLREICRIIVGPGGYPSVWIGFAEDDPGKTVRPVAQNGFEDGYLEALKITWADTALGRGPAGSALRLGKPCIVKDIQTDVNFAPWREAATRRGCASVLGLPLWANGRVFGALTIYSNTPDAFPSREVNVLMELADDLAYGIMALRTRAERQRAEEQLHRLADLQGAILNNTTYMVISTNEKGIITSINPAAERALGYTAGECIGKLMPTLFHDPDEMAERARVFSEELGVAIEPGFEVFVARARRDLPNEYEWMYLRRDGSRFPVLLSVAALRDSQRDIIGFLGIANDITGRKQAENALRASKQELNEAQRIAKAGSWTWEPEHDVVTWSEELYRISGVDPALPTPKYLELERFYTPEDWGRLRAAVDQALQTGMPYELDLELLRGDGRRGWTTARGEVQRDASGRVVKMRGTVQDITERKRAEEALHRSEQKFETIFRGSPVALTVSEFETGRFIEINEAFLRLMHGTSFDQLVGRTSLEVGLASAERKKIIAAVLRFGHVDRLEVAAKRLDGEPFTAEVSLSPYVIEGKSYLLTNIVDITERKQAREEIHQLNLDLEKRVMERTSDLAAANRELETFSFSVSHDLRSPLRIIDGFSKLLKEEYTDRLDLEAREYLDRISTAAERMDLLIRGLLNLSHITRSQIQHRPVNLSAMANAIAREIQGSDPQRVAEFVIAPDLSAKGDPELLRSVLQNLLGNAWKYTSKHPRARIEFGAEQGGGETVFYVRDDGAGFDPENAGKLFNAFQRLHDEKEFPGTGIGLTTVQRIIQRHGGRIWAEGAVNKGATFYFTLPSRK